jgi:hypothetical protein
MEQTSTTQSAQRIAARDAPAKIHETGEEDERRAREGKENGKNADPDPNAVSRDRRTNDFSLIPEIF